MPSIKDNSGETLLRWLPIIGQKYVPGGSLEALEEVRRRLDVYDKIKALHPEILREIEKE